MSKLPIPSWRELLTTPVHFFAFGFGTGKAPKAPGTVGTLVGIPFALALLPLGMVTYLVATTFMFVIGVWICERSSQLLGVHDHGGIVWDEFAGYFITMIAAPPGWIWIVVGFVLFRLFDIFKPWPIKWVDEHVDGGLGIMLDDMIAGLASFAVLQILAYFFIY